MRPKSHSLCSPTLTFDRDGARLLVVERDGVDVIDLLRADVVRIPQANAAAVTGFADQIWIASEDETLHRYTPTGTPIGEPFVLPFSERAQFTTAPCGPPAAIWGDLGFHSEGTGAQLVRTPLPPVDLALPITHRRFAIAAWRKLLLPSGKSASLDNTITGGAVLFDGAEAVLVLGEGKTRELALVSLTDGAVRTRIPAPAGILRLAHQTGIVIALTTPTTLVAIDMRTGVTHAPVEIAQPARELAIDPRGHWVVARGTSIEMFVLADLLRWAMEPTEPNVLAAALG
ncbi:MAG TPA: hypothetical protein VGC41_17870 [Kofleriaceae bacterium]